MFWKVILLFYNKRRNTFSFTSRCWWCPGVCGWRGRPVWGRRSSSSPRPATGQRWTPSPPCSAERSGSPPPGPSHSGNEPVANVNIRRRPSDMNSLESDMNWRLKMFFKKLNNYLMTWDRRGAAHLKRLKWNENLRDIQRPMKMRVLVLEKHKIKRALALPSAVVIFLLHTWIKSSAQTTFSFHYTDSVTSVGFFPHKNIWKTNFQRILRPSWFTSMWCSQHPVFVATKRRAVEELLAIRNSAGRL